jgi:N-acetyl-gamma-glutamyl-phosphate reductase
MIRVGIVGATGYGGRELLRLLTAHPETELTAVASTSVAGQSLASVLPAFEGLIDLTFEDFDAASLAKKCDVVFLATPSREAVAPGKALREAGVRVIDIGADFRLKNPDHYAQYYKGPHEAPELLSGSVYGLPPWYRDQLKDAELVAVPGCYPISIILPLRPLLDAPLSDVPVVINSYSGASGAGKSLSDALHFAEANENMRAYKVGVHQHVPEIEQELQQKMTVQFTPHVAPITRGILSTIALRPAELFDPAPYYARYADEPYIRVRGENVYPEVKYIRGTNFCDIGWTRDERTGNLIIVCAIDNLMGGTAGMAIQCLNIMYGLDEKTGLQWGGMAP